MRYYVEKSIKQEFEIKLKNKLILSYGIKDEEIFIEHIYEAPINERITYVIIDNHRVHMKIFDDHNIGMYSDSMHILDAYIDTIINNFSFLNIINEIGNDDVKALLYMRNDSAYVRKHCKKVFKETK